MPDKISLLNRLEQIGNVLKETENALALLALGSVGIELDRIDTYSDLDFFVIVKDGYKQEYLNNRSWLSDICGIGFEFQNTPDGYKALYIDNIFCEFAVFESCELGHIPFSEGRVVWKSGEFNENICIPQNKPTPNQSSVEYLVGEALTNLYIGLGRYKRGEQLSAFKFIQGYAVDRIVELADYIMKEQPTHKDAFAKDRRFEQRFPEITGHLPMFIQGYANSKESAIAILEFLDSNFDVNFFIKEKILDLCKAD